MIPAFNQSGVLPPFCGPSAADRSKMSPYSTSMDNLVARYGHSPERIAILRGLCAYREALASAGINQGFQWVCGSFTEDIEKLESRAPRDMDIITFAYRPPHLKDNNLWLAFSRQKQNIFFPPSVKASYKCDAYYVDMNKPPHLVVADTSYWFGLFSHRRDNVWKGMLKVELNTDDSVIRARLAGGVSC